MVMPLCSDGVNDMFPESKVGLIWTRKHADKDNKRKKLLLIFNIGARFDQGFPVHRYIHLYLFKPVWSNQLKLTLLSKGALEICAFV